MVFFLFIRSSCLFNAYFHFLMIYYVPFIYCFLLATCFTADSALFRLHSLHLFSAHLFLYDLKIDPFRFLYLLFIFFIPVNVFIKVGRRGKKTLLKSHHYISNCIFECVSAEISICHWLAHFLYLAYVQRTDIQRRSASFLPSTIFF